MPYRAATVYRTHAGLATASFKDFVTVAQENFTSQTEDVSVEDRLQMPLDVVIFFQE